MSERLTPEQAAENVCFDWKRSLGRGGSREELREHGLVKAIAAAISDAVAKADGERDEWKRAAESHAVDAARLEGQLRQEARNLALVVASKERAESAIRSALAQRDQEWREAVRASGLMLSPDGDNPAWSPLRALMKGEKHV